MLPKDQSLVAALPYFAYVAIGSSVLGILLIVFSRRIGSFLAGYHSKGRGKNIIEANLKFNPLMTENQYYAMTNPKRVAKSMRVIGVALLIQAVVLLVGFYFIYNSK